MWLVLGGAFRRFLLWQLLIFFLESKLLTTKRFLPFYVKGGKEQLPTLHVLTVVTWTVLTVVLNQQNLPFLFILLRA